MMGEETTWDWRMGNGRLPLECGGKECVTFEEENSQGEGTKGRYARQDWRYAQQYSGQGIPGWGVLQGIGKRG